VKPRPGTLTRNSPTATRDAEDHHPSIEQLVSYQAHSAAEDEAIQEHVASCGHCTQILLDLATFRGKSQADEEPFTRREASLVTKSVLAEHRRRNWVLATSLAAGFALSCLGLMLFREFSPSGRAPRAPRYAGFILPSGATSLPLASLYPTGSSRASDAVARLEIPPDAIAVGLVLGTGKVTHYRAYRLVIRGPSGREVSMASGLKPGEGGEFGVLVPAQELATGRHWIVLSGTVEGRQEVIEEYLLEVIHQG
jgi:hypothetical protein